MWILGVVCLALGHKAKSGTRRNFQGNSFARCKRCSLEIFRDPRGERWRVSRAADHRDRKLAIVSDERDGPKSGK
jgi:hypothetical protein